MNELDKQDHQPKGSKKTSVRRSSTLHAQAFFLKPLPSHPFPFQPQMPKVGPFLNCSQAETKSPSTSGARTPIILCSRFKKTTPHPKKIPAHAGFITGNPQTKTNTSPTFPDSFGHLGITAYFHGLIPSINMASLSTSGISAHGGPPSSSGPKAP